MIKLMVKVFREEPLMSMTWGSSRQVELSGGFELLL
jgi:hypothetical protein